MRCLPDLSTEDVFDELFKLAPEKVNAVKEVRKLKALSTSLAAAYPLPTCLTPQDEGTETGPSFHTEGAFCPPKPWAGGLVLS